MRFCRDVCITTAHLYEKIDEKTLRLPKNIILLHKMKVNLVQNT
jgi:hypothetical protein